MQFVLSFSITIIEHAIPQFLLEESLWQQLSKWIINSLYKNCNKEKANKKKKLQGKNKKATFSSYSMYDKHFLLSPNDRNATEIGWIACLLCVAFGSKKLLIHSYCKSRFWLYFMQKQNQNTSHWLEHAVAEIYF